MGATRTDRAPGCTAQMGGAVLRGTAVIGGHLPGDHAAYAELKNAIETGKPLDPDRIAASVLKQLDTRLRKEGVHGDICGRQMGAAWAPLDPAVRDMLSLTQDHVAYADQHALKDCGPALMYLTKALEELLREGVATVLERRATTIRVEVPWDEFTLGCASRRMLERASGTSPQFRQLSDGVLRGLPELVRTYMGRAWEEDAQLLADTRNASAHRRDVISRQDFEQVLSAVVGAPGTRTVLGAALTLQQMMGR